MKLTPRHRQIALLVTEGLQSKHIAARLELSERTVEWHIAKLFRKFGAHNRAGFVYRFLKDSG